jgi:hypothetical protein
VWQHIGELVQSHIPSVRLGVASSLVEHWLFGPGVIAGPASTAVLAQHGTRVRETDGPSTLLGPEGTAATGTEQGAGADTSARTGSFVASCVAGPGPPVS